MTHKTVRRTLLIEIEMPAGSWSSTVMESDLLRRWPEVQPVVLGSISGGEVDAAWRKLCQLARETEADAPKDDRVHSAYKAQSFWRDVFPGRFWSWNMIGEDQRRRRDLLKGPGA